MEHYEGDFTVGRSTVTNLGYVDDIMLTANSRKNSKT